MNAKAPWVVMCLVLGAGLTALLFSSPRDPRDIARETFPSVVLLSMTDASGESISIGSGFFVLPDVVATNWHVVDGTTRGYAKRIGDATHYPVAGVVALDEQHDLVLLEITGSTSTPLELADPDVVAIGERVFTVGSPRGYEGTFSDGIVSGIRTSGVARLLQITSPIARGSSGGPVVNARGRVVGVTVALVEGEQNLNFALPISYVTQLLRRVQPVTALGSLRPDARYGQADVKVTSPSGERVSDAILTVDTTAVHSGVH